jgi:dTDP-4-amino-4,6-dideoxygalactose transaminase
MQRLEKLLANRERVARWYGEWLAGLDLVKVPAIVPTTTRMSWFVYVVRIEPPASREEVMRRLDEAGIPSRPYFTPIHLQPFYRDKFGYGRGDYPQTEHLGDVSLALPFSGVMHEEEVEQVCDRLRTAVRNPQS